MLLIALRALGATEEKLPLAQGFAAFTFLAPIPVGAVAYGLCGDGSARRRVTRRR